MFSGVYWDWEGLGTGCGDWAWAGYGTGSLVWLIIYYGYGERCEKQWF